MEKTAVLDYIDVDNRLILRTNFDNDDFQDFISSGYISIKLNPYIDKCTRNTVFFNKDLSYTDFETLNSMLERIFKNDDVVYYCSEDLLNYIKKRQIYISNRYEIGKSIKNHDPIIMDNFTKYSNYVNSFMARKLRDQQMWDSFFMYSMKKSSNFSVPGSGKTASALGVFAFLYIKKITKRIVMIGPKNSFGSWIDEFNTCFRNKIELKTFNIHDSKFKNTTEKKAELKYNYLGYNLFLFNYESLSSYKEQIIRIVDKDTLLIYDEVHKVKQINGVLANQALRIAKNSDYTITMTGTPIPNSYKDIYNNLNILFSHEYKDFFGFSVSTLSNPNERDKELINTRIQPFFCRTTKEQLSVPPSNRDIILNNPVSQKEQDLFEIVMAKYNKNKLVLFIRLLQMESNPDLLLAPLLKSDFKDMFDDLENIEEIDYVDNSKKVLNLIQEIKLPSKKKYCLGLIKELVSNKKKVILWCIFTNTIYSFQIYLSEMGINAKIINGEVKLEDRFQIIEDFKNDSFDVLITNPHTLAESVSLHSVCHDAIYFEFSYNLVHLLQSKDRIHRLGLPTNVETQWYFMENTYTYRDQKFSFDEKIYKRLAEKEATMLKCIENNELEEATTSQEDLDLIFKDILN